MTEDFSAVENDDSRLLVQHQFRFLVPRAILTLAGFLALFACTATPATTEKVLRIVPQSDLASLDPVYTTAGVTYNHANMIYDTLFGIDANGQISKQMLLSYETSPDKKIWNFTLRDGLEFHDGKPVTSDDVIASLKRWGQKDTVGQRLLSFVDVDGWEALNAKTFRMKLKEPYGLVLESLWGPFIMPKRVADISANKEIEDTTGSGPFIYKKDESKRGEKLIYIRNTKYKPRTEPASGTAGGKVVKVDRVEWHIIKDSQTAVNALTAGEVDLIEQPAYEQYSALESNPDIQMVLINPLGGQFVLRFNHLQAPFSNPKVRQAAMAALNQPSFLQTQVGIPARYRTCFSIYPCNTPYFSSKGMDFISKPDIKSAQQLLKESGYNGEIVVVMQPTDQANIGKLPRVAAQLLSQAGFKVDLQAMDWQTLGARRAMKSGWNIFITASGAATVMDPVSNFALSAACDKAWPGWPCDPELEKLRDEFARASDDKARKVLAEDVQVRAMEIGVYVPLGEYVRAIAARNTVKGLVQGYSMVLWNVEKQ
jgi:peptide/nickel transport system substrate-binding protein